MNKSTNTKKTWLVAVFVSAVLVGSLIATQDNLAFAGGKQKKSNEAAQDISQIQGLDQSASVSSWGDSIASGNNLGFLFQLNEGNNALGQQ